RNGCRSGKCKGFRNGYNIIYFTTIGIPHADYIASSSKVIKGVVWTECASIDTVSIRALASRTTYHDLALGVPTTHIVRCGDTHGHRRILGNTDCINGLTITGGTIIVPYIDIIG